MPYCTVTNIQIPVLELYSDFTHIDTVAETNMYTVDSKTNIMNLTFKLDDEIPVDLRASPILALLTRFLSSTGNFLSHSI